MASIFPSMEWRDPHPLLLHHSHQKAQWAPAFHFTTWRNALCYHFFFFFFFPGMKALSPLCSLMQDWKSSNRCWHIFQWEWLAVKVKHLSVQSRMIVSTRVSLRCIWLWSNVAFPWLESLKPLARSAQEFHVKWFSPGRCVCPFSNSYCHLFIYLFSEKVVFSVWVEG